MSLEMGLTVQLPQFEGPLALLLYLIRKEEMDILNIPVQRITEQYLEYIKLMKELDLELAGEFVAMAATLIHIKSRMLLPQYDDNGEVIEGDDPRKELVQRLIEYQKYQEAGRLLYERPLLGRDLWSRGFREKLEITEEDIVTEENALFGLISAYRRALRSAKAKVHRVASKLQSISSRILQMKDLLLVGVRVRMNDLVTAVENRRGQGLITFLSLLELAKLGFISLFQTDVYQDIHIEALKPIETDVLSKVEEYDNLHSEEAAEKLSQVLRVESLDPEVEPTAALEATTQDGEQLLLDENLADENFVADLGVEAASDQEILAEEMALGMTEEILEPVVAEPKEDQGNEGVLA